MSPAALSRPIPFDAGMLLVANAERLLGYNESAHQIWCALALGHTPEQVASALAQNSGMSPAKATADVDAIVAEWRAEGLLDGPPPAADPANNSDDCGTAREVGWAASWLCRFGERVVQFAVEDPGAVALLRESLRTLEVSDGTPETRIEVCAGAEGLSVVRRAGSPSRKSGRSQGLKEAVYEALMEFLWPTRAVETLIHASAVARGDAAICFPAASGSGKSTLVAHLCGHGFTYLADDLTAIDRTLAVLPLPVPIRLKEGSWPLVGHLFPELPSSPGFRVGQTQTRLVTPAAAWDARPTRLGALIFPRYVAGSVAGVRRIRPFDALIRLQAAGVWIGYPLTEDRVTRLARWLESTPAYALEHGSLEAAAAGVDQVVAGLGR